MEIVAKRSNRLAVVPSEVSSQDGADESYFCDGFIVDLLTELSRFSDIDVISPHSSFAPNIRELDNSGIASEFNIDLLLKTGVRKRSDSVRINAQLIDLESGSLLWAEHYDAKLEELFQIQDRLVGQVSAELSRRIGSAKLEAARRKPVTELEAYDWWLRGMDKLRLGNLEGDELARADFEHALEKDPLFARAYIGLSLSHFNEWSCQNWELSELSECRAFQYASKALELDPNDSMAHNVLARVYLFRGKFERSETHMERACELNPNDADSLVMISAGYAFLGKPEKGEEFWNRAIRLNPYFDPWYYAYGAFVRIMRKEFEEGIEMGLKAPLTTVWIDLAAFISIAYAWLGNYEEAKVYREIFLGAFREKITRGREPEPNEAFDWLLHVNRYKRDEDGEFYRKGLELAGFLTEAPLPSGSGSAGLETTEVECGPLFRVENDIRHIALDGVRLQLPEVKGFGDVEQLMRRQGEEIHCTELMGTVSETGESCEVMDAKARRDCAVRIRELQADLLEARESNDLARAERIQEELDPLLDHLAKAVGIGGRSRRLAAPAERARSAVTWRIRSAIKKIESADEALGRHFSNAIRTGTFCSYQPEKPVAWKF